jgi:hypothetical protein
MRAAVTDFICNYCKDQFPTHELNADYLKRSGLSVCDDCAEELTIQDELFDELGLD